MNTTYMPTVTFGVSFAASVTAVGIEPMRAGHVCMRSSAHSRARGVPVCVEEEKLCPVNSNARAAVTRKPKY